MMKMESKTERAMMRLLKELAISFVERTEIVNIFPRRPNNPIKGCKFRVIYNSFPNFLLDYLPSKVPPAIMYSYPLHRNPQCKDDCSSEICCNKEGII